MSNNMKIIYTLLGVIFLFFAGMLLYFLLDASPYEDTHLEFIQKEIPADENGYLELVAASKLSVSLQDIKKTDSVYISKIDGPDRRSVLVEGCLAFSKFDETFAKEYLRVNKNALEKTLNSLKYKRFYIELSKANGYFDYHILDRRSMLELMLLRSQLFLFQKKKEGYRRSMNDMLRLLIMINKSGKDGVFRAFYNHASSLVLMSVRKAIQIGLLDPDEVFLEFGYFAGYRSSWELFDEVVKCYYQFNKNTFENELSGYLKYGPSDIRTKLLFKKNISIRLMGEYMTRCIDNKENAFVSDPVLKNIDNFIISLRKTPYQLNVINRNLIGLELLRRFLSSVEIYRLQFNSFHSELSLLDTFVAIKRYEKKHGKLPDKLIELIPKFLEKVPVDEQDKKPVKYSKAKKMIWVLHGPIAGLAYPSYLKKEHAVIYLK